MLMISRRESESLWIGGVRVMVSSIRPGQVRIGVEAPTGMHVRRFELPSKCSCDAHGSCELHGCGCVVGIHGEAVGDEIRHWCPKHNVTWVVKKVAA